MARLRAVLLGNWQLKLAGLVVALFVWAWVRTGRLEKVSITVPLEYANMPRSVRFVRRPPSTISVTVRADPSSIGALSGGAMKVVADLEGVAPGEETIGIDLEDVVHPLDVWVISVAPSSLDLSFRKARRGE
jgi:hypothetical protein